MPGEVIFGGEPWRDRAEILARVLLEFVRTSEIGGQGPNPGGALSLLSQSVKQTVRATGDNRGHGSNPVCQRLVSL